MDGKNETEEANKATVRRLVEEAIGQGQLRLLLEIIDAGHVSHLAIGDHYGPEGVRIDIAAYRAALSGLAVTLDDLFADGDKVARRFTISGTLLRPPDDALQAGKMVVLHGIAIDRMVEGRVAESWVHVDSIPRIIPGTGTGDGR